MGKRIVLCVVLIGVLASSPARASSPEIDLIALINQQRVSRGIPPLRAAQSLMDIALAHSLDMALNDFLSHYGSDGRSPWQRMTDAGYPWPPAGETIHAGSSRPETVVRSWMASPRHRAILLGSELCEVGTGYASNPEATWRHYWTADFGCRPPCAEEGSCPFDAFLPAIMQRH